MPRSLSDRAMNFAISSSSSNLLLKSCCRRWDQTPSVSNITASATQVSGFRDSEKRRGKSSCEGSDAIPNVIPELDSPTITQRKRDPFHEVSSTLENETPWGFRRWIKRVTWFLTIQSHAVYATYDTEPKSSRFLLKSPYPLTCKGLVSGNQVANSKTPRVSLVSTLGTKQQAPTRSRHSSFSIGSFSSSVQLY
ncbi:hypothetical protein Scep_000012 [Stephania cephalantha]|uniref:Uncharacterized protein n=1 Tax=Stephania cephalantha TaxID=152367 RepID=A0AAP0L5R1_9MAGN